MPLQRPRPNHAALLENPDIRRWHANVAQGSPITADVYLRRLGAFCLQVDILPEKLATMKEADLHALLLDFIAAETKRKKTGSYIHSTLKAVRSWLSHHGIQLTRPIKIAGASATPTLSEERIPTQEELRRIFLAAYLKERVSCVLMAQAGLRPEVLGNYAGDDGLTLKDLPELEIRKDHVEFSKIPTMVVVRPELSKARHKYFSFLGSEGCSYVRDYLEERLRTGEKLSPDTDLISPTGWRKDFIKTTKISTGIRNAIRSAGFSWRPYVLRAYFDTQLLLAESKGKVAHDYRVFWMGHKGSMESRYTTNKGRLPQHFIEDMRQAYNRCEPFLGTVAGVDASQVDSAVNRQFLRLAGYSEEELAEVDVSDVEKVRELARERLASSAVSEPSPAETPPSPHGPRVEQVVVSPGAVAALISHGWRYVDKLAPDQVIMASPSTPGTSPTPASSRPTPRVPSGPVHPAGQHGAGGGEEVSQPLASGPSGRLPLRALARRAHSLWEENAARQAGGAHHDLPEAPARMEG